MKWWSSSYPEPLPPENVRIVLEDGSEVSADCVFVGIEDGVAVWELIVHVNAGRVAQIKVDVLPAKTAIRFPLQSM